MIIQEIMNEVYAKHDAECLLLIEQLNKTIIERDEARRECCVWGSRTEMGARSLAKFKGWDCYKKEETQ